MAALPRRNSFTSRACPLRDLPQMMQIYSWETQGKLSEAVRAEVPSSVTTSKLPSFFWASSSRTVRQSPIKRIDCILASSAPPPHRRLSSVFSQPFSTMASITYKLGLNKKAMDFSMQGVDADDGKADAVDADGDGVMDDRHTYTAPGIDPFVAAAAKTPKSTSMDCFRYIIEDVPTKTRGCTTSSCRATAASSRPR